MDQQLQGAKKIPKRIKRITFQIKLPFLKWKIYVMPCGVLLVWPGYYVSVLPHQFKTSPFGPWTTTTGPGESRLCLFTDLKSQLKRSHKYEKIKKT